MPKLQLPSITLVQVDCLDHKRAMRVITHCRALCDFGDIKLFTHFKENGLYDVIIPRIQSIKDYSRFIMKEMAPHIKTDFALVTQNDGIIVNPRAWRKEFLNYDYIGSPWFPSQVKYDKSHVVGNGGFSMRSKRLLDFLQNDEVTVETHPEDVMICQLYRPYLESKGFTFAPVDIASDFGFENGTYNGAFGAHCLYLLDPRRFK